LLRGSAIGGADLVNAPKDARRARVRVEVEVVSPSVARSRAAADLQPAMSKPVVFQNVDDSSTAHHVAIAARGSTAGLAHGQPELITKDL
jgi:hypothetical protein